MPRIFRSARPADAQEWTSWSNLDYVAKFLSSATVATNLTEDPVTGPYTKAFAASLEDPTLLC